MKLSHEHHLALVLARRVKLGAAGGEAFDKLMEAFPRQWEKEIAPHFAEEERTILPRLVAAGAVALYGRFQKEHAELRKLSALAVGGDNVALKRFGKLIHDHIRFEEREMFPFYEELIGV